MKTRGHGACLLISLFRRSEFEFRLSLQFLGEMLLEMTIERTGAYL